MVFETQAITRVILILCQRNRVFIEVREYLLENPKTNDCYEDNFTTLLTSVIDVLTLNILFRS